MVNSYCMCHGLCRTNTDIDIIILKVLYNSKCLISYKMKTKSFSQSVGLWQRWMLRGRSKANGWRHSSWTFNPMPRGRWENPFRMFSEEYSQQGDRAKTFVFSPDLISILLLTHIHTHTEVAFWRTFSEQHHHHHNYSGRIHLAPDKIIHSARVCHRLNYRYE